VPLARPGRLPLYGALVQGGHRKVMRNINESHFGPGSVGKINVTYQNATRTKSKGSIKGNSSFVY
jgi:hypothetical protein